MRRFSSNLLVVTGLGLLGSPAYAGGDFYLPAGDLIPGSGEGLAEPTAFAPGMRFPIEDGPAYPNSQVYNAGGYLGPGGGQCDASNYDYPWRDNYCETRSWDMPLCPAGVGHQGQDIRAATCETLVHWNVAAEAGTVTNIGSYSVYITAADGTRFDYLHGGGNIISSGQGMAKAERINRVSNEFGGTATSIHLHFNIKQDVAGVGFVFVSPYMSLVHSYEELMGLGTSPPAGPVDAVDCESIRGWAQDGDTPDAPVDVNVYFDGTSDDPNATGISISADEHRQDLCDALGSCEHGFTIAIPKSLRDNTPHPVHVYAVDTEGSDTIQLEASPGTFSCPPAAVPPGIRRQVASPEVLAEWGLSPFWDLTQLDDPQLAAIDVGPSLPDERLVVRGDGADATWWVIEDGRRRRIASDAVADAWGIVEADVMPWPEDSLLDVPLGTDLPAEPFLVSGSDGVMWVIDDAQCEPGTDCEGASDGGGADGGSDAGGDAGGDGGGDGTDGGESLPGADGSDDGGCGCTTDAGHGRSTAWALLMFGLVGWRRRRR
jgi:MYXO-CTERM domain-containing protein